MDQKSAMVCPKCGSDAVSARGKQFAIYPVGCLFFFGVVWSIAHQLSTPMLYRCRDCKCEFGKRTFLARVALVIVVVAVVLIFLRLAIELAGLL